MSRTKLTASLLRRIEQNSHIRVMVKMKDTDQYLEAGHSLSQASCNGGRAPAIEKLRQSAKQCQEGCHRLIEQAAANRVNGFARLGMTRASKARPVRSFWLTNAMALDATSDLLAEMADQEDVAYIREIEVQAPLKPLAGTEPVQNGYTWGLSKLRIPEIWAAGFRGDGVRVGHLDTGADGTHPDLMGRIEKFVVVDDFGEEIREQTVATDSDMHGTHTAGTIVGGDSSGTAIGVAPNARLYSAMVIEGGQALDRVLAGMQWAAEQDVQVLSMSLGFYPGEAFEDDFEEAVNNLVALNVFPAIAIGNEGVHTTRAPGLNVHSWSVGATNAEDVVADFSGGKVVRLRYDIRQPDITAPGVNVYSAVPGNGYDSLAGTSMATPHVAGVVALLRQANPSVSVEDLKRVIAETAIDLGRDGDDIRYGWGRIQPVEALNQLLS